MLPRLAAVTSGHLDVYQKILYNNEMTNMVHAAARTEAVGISRCPAEDLVSELKRKREYEDGVRACVFVDPPGSPLAEVVAHRQKPTTYGLFGRFITTTLRQTFAERPSLEPLGLRVYGDEGEMRPATLEDAVTWQGLQNCWSNTVHYNMGRILDRARNSHDPQIFALDSLWGIRIRAHAGDRTLREQFKAGSDTGTVQCMREAYGINRFLDENRINGQQKITLLRRSTGPILEDTQLELGQFMTLNLLYKGEKVDFTGHHRTTVLNRIRTDIYALQSNGRVGHKDPLETLEAFEYPTIGDVPPLMSGERIGCPIGFTPRQTQGLWGAFVDTLQIAGLVE